MRSRFPDRSLAISRTLDATQLNDVANHPDVRAHLLLPSDGQVDLTPLVENPANYAMVAAHGGFLGLVQGYGRYEVHSLFSPRRDAKETITAVREAAEYMFTRTDCLELVTKVPDGNRPAGVLAKMMGFDELFTTAVHPQMSTRARYSVLSLDRWATHACGAAQYGAWFHETLGMAKAEAQSPLPIHGDDTLHDQMVGVTVWMLYGGQAEKAIAFYNRWARWTGYAPITLISLQPLVLTVQDAMVEVRQTELEVLRCPQE